jgi:hypothetical protein
LTQDEHLAEIRARCAELAVALREASDAGVSHALIIPQLMLVFRDAFGELPAGMTVPGLP